MSTEWKELRCPNCDRLLCEVEIIDGKVRQQCDRCKDVLVYEVCAPVSYSELLKYLLERQQGKQGE